MGLIAFVLLTLLTYSSFRTYLRVKRVSEQTRIRKKTIFMDELMFNSFFTFVMFLLITVLYFCIEVVYYVVD